jgi:hypothetical protein
LNVEGLLDQLENSRERLLVALASLPDEALTTTQVMDDWTIADILAHLVAWESEMVTALLRIDQGKRPAKLLEGYADIEGYNALRYKENKDRSLDSIFDDLHGVRRQLEGWLESFSERDLNDPKRYNWAKGKPLWEFIAETSYGHEIKHLPDIEDFAARWHQRQSR